MLARYDDMFDTLATDVDRNVMNEGEKPSDFVVTTNYEKRAEARSSRYDSAKFTDTSAKFWDPIEDEDLLSGVTKPTVLGYYDTDYDGTPNYYNPSLDKVSSRATPNEPMAIGKMPKEAYGKPEFFENSFDLGIASIILVAIVILEIICLVGIF